MDKKTLDSKLEEFHKIHDEVQVDWKKLTKHGLNEARYQDLEIIISKLKNKKKGSVNIYIDGELFDDSELLILAKNRDPILYKKYEQKKSELERLGKELEPYLVELKKKYQ